MDPETPAILDPNEVAPDGEIFETPDAKTLHLEREADEQQLAYLGDDEHASL